MISCSHELEEDEMRYDTLSEYDEEINGNYIETLGRDDELAIDCADAQLWLIKEIIDRVEKI